MTPMIRLLQDMMGTHGSGPVNLLELAIDPPKLVVVPLELVVDR